MSKLEKSVRHEMNHYGAALRSGKYWPFGETGVVPCGSRGYVQSAFADVDNGTCTDITIYTVGDARQRKHAECGDGSVDITECINDYLRGDLDGWDGLIDAIFKQISEAA